MWFDNVSEKKKKVSYRNRSRVSIRVTKNFGQGMVDP